MGQPGTIRALPAAEAVDLLDGVRHGWRDDALGLLADRPLLAVDVTGAAPGLDLSAPEALPLVVVAIDRSATPRAGGGADVQLAEAPGPAPWVCPPGGVDAGLAGLAETVGGNPMAATTLVQLLRVTGSLDVVEAVVAESLAYSMLQGGPEHARWLAARRALAARRPPRDGPHPPPTPEPPVVIARDGDRLSITLNRPARRNAYNAEMRDGLCEALAVATSDPGVGRIHLDGRGPSFSSGGDLDEFGTRDDPVTAHTIRTTRNAGIRLAQLADRTTVVVHGPCFGAGVELPAFAADVAARPGTTFTLPETAMGLLPGAGGTVSIPRRIGAGRTAWLALAGTALDLATALEWGLVDRIEPAPG